MQWIGSHRPGVDGLGLRYGIHDRDIDVDGDNDKHFLRSPRK